MKRWNLPEVFLLVQYVLAAFGKVPTWHCVPTAMVVAFLYLYEEGKEARRQAAEDARRHARSKTLAPVTLHPRKRSNDAH